MRIKLLFIILSAGLLSSCATSPTGRSQLLMMSAGEMDQMGAQSFAALKNKLTIEKGSRVNAYVRCIANAITQEVGGSWEVVVFKDPSANAFALPSRKIGVHTGLLKVAKNQDQLASVLGHEVAHVLANHSNERVSQETAVKQSLAFAQAITSPQTGLGQTGMALLGVGAEYGILMPYSRAHESEADIYGLDLMAKAGFDPRESVNLWRNMAAASGGQAPIEFMSTHPSHNTRITNLQAHIPAALQLQKRANAQGKRPECRR
ncbi:MAG: M48 family metalloprotease [Methyloprofundus sp.]|nr:M48 family metalloprotease [Methyloprofundus sp.]